MEDFETKWRRKLRTIKVKDIEDDLFDEEYVYYEEILAREAQIDIDHIKKPITTNDLLVINHPFCDSIKINGSIPKREGIHYQYHKNLDELLKGVDSSRINVAFFECPEIYVWDTKSRLLRGEIQTVILTEYMGGGSRFNGKAYEEIGQKKHIYLAGQTVYCLATTAEELYDNDNEITVIDDATFVEKGIATEDNGRERLIREFEVEGLQFITTKDFLRKFGKII